MHNQRIVLFLSFLLTLNGCRTRNANVNEDTPFQKVEQFETFEDETAEDQGLQRVCDSEVPERRYFLDEPTERNLANWSSNFEAAIEQNPNALSLLKKRDHRFATFMWGESAYSFIRLTQAFDLSLIERAYPTFKGETAEWYTNLTKNFEEALGNLSQGQQSRSPRIVHRGAKTLDTEMLQCWQSQIDSQGKYIELGAGGRRGAASTSARVDVAEKFSGAGGFMFTIRASSLVDISLFKKNPTETEFVVLPGARFQIKAIEKRDSRTWISLEELSLGGDSL